MSMMNPSGYGQQDASAFSRNWPGGNSPAPATSQVAGVAQPVARAVESSGGATMPWLTCIGVLFVVRLLSHLRGGE